MDTPDTPLYSADERARLEDRLRRGGPLHCPRCDGIVDRRDVPPRPGVAYVRTRIWLVCRSCRRSLVVDRRRVEGS